MPGLTRISAPGEGAAALPGAAVTSFLLYLLAYAGAFISFIPFFGILLPLKAEAIAPDGALRLLSIVTVGGVIASSLANILFGMLSDWTRRRTGTRRPWIAAGALAVAIAYAAVGLAGNAGQLVAAVVALQVAINMMFAPLVAVMADEVPDVWKGRVAALVGVAHPLASLLGALLLVPALADETRQLLVVAGLVVITILSFCWRFREQGMGEGGVRRPALHVRDLTLAWISRLLVQIAATTVTTYVFIHFSRLSAVFADAAPGTARQRIAVIMALGTIAAIPVALAAGWGSDRLGQRKPLLLVAAAGMTAGLLGVSAPASWWWAGTAHILFACSYCSFLGLDAAYAMEVISPDHRGRDLGLLNLTNTLPAAVAPGVILTVNATDLTPLFLSLAALTGAAGLIVAGLGREPSAAGSQSGALRFLRPTATMMTMKAARRRR